MPAEAGRSRHDDQEIHHAQGRAREQGEEEAQPLDQGAAGQEEGEAGLEAGGHVGDRGAEVRIEKVVYGGSGLGHVEGRPVLVTFSAPGDRLLVRIEDRAPGASRRVLHGSIESVLEPSPDRTEPACRHFGACGGCQLQHLSREAELRAKTGFLRDCLRRIAGIRWEPEIAIESGPEYGWRSRVALHVSAERRAGFFRAGGREIVAIEDCPVLVPPLRELVRRFAAGGATLPEGAQELALVAGDEGEIAGMSPGSVRQTISGLAFEFEASSFSQANRTMVEKLVERATEGAEGGIALDLYAGSGLFALPLARRCELVHAVESDAAGVRSGRENARQNRIENVRYHEADVGAWLASTAASLRPDRVLLDPPRTGAGPGVVEHIVDLAPRDVTYVSCDPATWARDLRRFVDAGYALRSVEALDLFPRSYHVEAIARLTSPAEEG